MATKELTSGSPIKLITFFMLPIFLGNIFQQLYNLVDALIVGRIIGINALAAVGATSPIIFMIISFIFASTQGFTVITAQKFGAREYDLVKKSLAASIVLSAALTIIVTLISAPFSYQMLAFLRTPADIIHMADTYLFIMLVGIFATVFYNLSSNIIRALGDSKTPLYFLIFASILNVFLDIYFIVNLKMGIVGAGWATVLSQAISTILCLAFMFWKFPILRLKKEDWIVSKDFYMEHLRVGIPMGFQMSVLSIGIIALQFVLNGFGSVAVAAFTTAMRVDQLFTQVYLALGATMAVFAAQNFGAKKLSRIKEGAKASILIAFITSIFSILVLTFFSGDLVALFMSEVDPEVVRLAEIYLHILMIFFFFLGVLLIFRNILQGMGSVMAPLASGIAELIARTACAFIFGHYFGYVGICTATPAAWAAAALVLFIGYKISLIKHVKTIRKRA
ncbi:MAG: MATE family efflux transporter [Candidatus Gastranaerophilaceae bacterium]